MKEWVKYETYFHFLENLFFWFLLFQQFHILKDDGNDVIDVIYQSKKEMIKVKKTTKKLVRRVEPTKQYTKSQNKDAPETKQLKIKGVKYPN